jgi:hypothetical protein
MNNSRYISLAAAEFSERTYGISYSPTKALRRYNFILNNSRKFGIPPPLREGLYTLGDCYRQFEKT